GAVEHLPVVQVTNSGRAIELVKERGYWAIGLAVSRTSAPIFTADLPEPVLLVVGAEGRGISPGLARHLDLAVEIPMLGRIESLNAAVAGSIALYELVRRRLDNP
ncbi:MAG TPA: TrmH family RNA methyltransferase, partial [Thermomicrobiaceae bacterium]|nr:TrmH family RNA methyltransferase [Thermomicrobiaceae bacterium]